MKFMIAFFLFISLLTLCGCGLNTKFDDSEYRPVGASKPLNSDTHTLSETRKTIIEHETESVATRYVLPNSEPVVKQNSKEHAAKMTTTPTPQTDRIKEDIISTTIKEVFNSRYGNPETILKISKTVLIHCNDRPIMQSADSSATICQYQFPKFCGAHRFSVISKEHKQLLMYLDRNYQRNVIDTLAGDHQSAPGLWDNDDYVSSELLTVSQVLDKKAMDSNSLGWIINADNKEKTQLGRSYYAAINETSKCF